MKVEFKLRNKLDNLNCQKTEKTLFFIKAPDYWIQL